jgi:polysaccharide export outer membrane protein
MALRHRLRVSFKLLGRIACTATLLTLELSWSAAAEYRLHAGDVIEVTIAGLPQFGQRTPVQLDGSITIPTIGALDVEGATLANIRDRIQDAFTSRLLTLYAADGREFTRTVEREDVSAAIVQYAPVWVSGDVVRSGELPFQPRMTVRQAIASAGGLRPNIVNAGVQPYDSIALRSDYIASWLALAGDTARAWRLRAELGEAAEFDKASVPPAPIPEDALTRIVLIEEQIRELRSVNFDRERAYLEKSASLAEEQIQSLSARIKLEAQGELDDIEEYKRMQELARKKLVESSRVVDARRALLYSSTRRLQTENELMQVRRRLDESRRSLEKLDGQRRIDIHEELQSVEMKQAEEHARFQGLRAKLDLAGIAVPSDSTREASPSIVVIRRIDMKPVVIDAEYEDEIEPGDTVEVRLDQQGLLVSRDRGATALERPRYAQETK